ncbi:MAG: rRNA maturation RNase YbeY [Firmicutes bacterium]|nr:rRNA maturation RNase YbeY [Bacillota bacterium]
MLILIDKKLNEKHQKILTQTYLTLNLSGILAVELEFIDKASMQELNNSTRQKDCPTDVLSFGFLSLQPSTRNYPAFIKENFPLDYSEEHQAVFLGSIVICEEVAKKQAIEYGQTDEEETSYLLVHGLLHLLGYDHELGEKEEKIMRELEEKILCRRQ